MLDHSEERRQHAQICIAAYQHQIRAARHKKVKSREFQIRDMVLKRVIHTTQQKDQRKLGPSWQGAYIIIACGGKGSYTLVDQDGNQLNRQ